MGLNLIHPMALQENQGRLPDALPTAPAAVEGTRFKSVAVVIVLLLIIAGGVQAAAPSRVLELRDRGEKVRIGLAIAADGVGIYAPGGIRVLTEEEEVVAETEAALHFGVVGNRAMQPAVVFRVQVKAVRDRQAAQEVCRQVQAQIAAPVFVEYASPWFKVQVGNVTTREEAKALRQKLIALGYSDSWITTARLSPPAEKVERGTEIGLPFAFVLTDNRGEQVATVTASSLVIQSVRGEPLAVNMGERKSGRYRGNIHLTALSEGRMQVINVVGLEEYLYGVVGAELYSKDPQELEALKAQAVAARTYTIHNLDKHWQDGFDLCATTHCHVYKGVAEESDLIRQAVDATRGQILTYGGQTISAVYHSNSGGHTAGAEQVWRTRYCAYLRPVKDEVLDPETGELVKVGEDEPDYAWEVTWQGEELSRIMARNLPAVGMEVPDALKGDTARLADIVIAGRSPSGRVTRLVLRFDIAASPAAGRGKADEATVTVGSSETGDKISVTSKGEVVTDGSGMGEAQAEFSGSDWKASSIVTPADSRHLEYVVEKDKIRWVLRKPGGGVLPSTLFSLDVVREENRVVQVTARGYGNGHGLGLAQNGALHMARLGYDYKEILAHYYRNVRLTSLSDYYEAMEKQLVWEKWGLIRSWVAALDEEEGIVTGGLLKWSPAGDKIAFAGSAEKTGLWVFDTYTGEMTHLLAGSIRDFAWSSDGLALAVIYSEAAEKRTSEGEAVKERGSESQPVERKMGEGKTTKGQAEKGNAMEETGESKTSGGKTGEDKIAGDKITQEKIAQDRIARDKLCRLVVLPLDVQTGNPGQIAFRVKIIGGSTRSILAEASDLASPVWLPGTDFILFVQNNMIYGGRGQRAIPLLTDATLPAPAPNGEEMAFLRRGMIWLYNLKTGESRQLLKAGKVTSLKWSSGGRQLLVETDEDFMVFDVQQGTLIHRIRGQSPTWSSDGRFVAYEATGSEETPTRGTMQTDIFLLNVESGQSVALTDTPDHSEHAPDWSREGNSLAYSVEGSIELMTWR